MKELKWIASTVDPGRCVLIIADVNEPNSRQNKFINSFIPRTAMCMYERIYICI